MGPLSNPNKEHHMVKFIKEVRRQVLWMQAFGFVFPWQAEWWRIVYRRVVKHNG
jgi:hypothetical protein